MRTFSFLGVDGFDVQYGLSTPNLLEAKVNRAMMDISKVAVASAIPASSEEKLVIDSPPSSLQNVITDRGIPKGDLRALRKSRV